jgi:hypothetical protein
VPVTSAAKSDSGTAAVRRIVGIFMFCDVYQITDATDIR